MALLAHKLHLANVRRVINRWTKRTLAKFSGESTSAPRQLGLSALGRLPDAPKGQE
jgi:hypothetical protein